MTGDKYQVFISEDGHTAPFHTPVDSWREAKQLRAAAFSSHHKARAVWVMRNNPSLDLRPEKCGFVLRRTRHEVAA